MEMDENEFERTFDRLRVLGRGNYGVTWLMRDRSTSLLYAGKFMERGPAVGDLEMTCAAIKSPRLPPPPPPPPPPDHRSQRTASDPPCLCRSQINVDVEREVLNHRQLAHPFIIKFKKVLMDSAVYRRLPPVLAELYVFRLRLCIANLSHVEAGHAHSDAPGCHYGVRIRGANYSHTYSRAGDSQRMHPASSSSS